MIARRRRRPAPGGGLAVLVVVTVLAALAAPHAKAVRGLVAGGLPAITAPRGPLPRRPPGPRRGLSLPPTPLGADPPADCRSPRLDRRVRHLLVAARRPPPDPGVVPAHRPFLVRQGHPPGLQPLGVGGVDVDQVDGRPVSPVRSTAAAGWPCGSAGPGRGQPSEVGSPWRFGGRPWFTDAGHQGHLHVGFAGPTQPVEGPDDRPGPGSGRWGCAAP